MQLSAKDELKRQKILTGNIYYLLFYLSLPLIMYYGFNFLYTMLDAAIVSDISKNAVSSIFFFDQIKNVISSVGLGLAAGGTVYIARLYGANKIDKAKNAVTTLFWISFIVSFLVIFLTVPFSGLILKVSGATQGQIDSSKNYFNVQVITLAVIGVNTIYLGVERARGNTLRLFYLNIVVVIIKVVLSILFVKVLGYGTTSVGFATLIAQLFLCFVGLYIMANKNNPLRLSLRYDKSNFNKEFYKGIMSLSIPIIVGRLIFSVGKVIVSSLSIGYYGEEVVAALGIAGTIGGISGMFYHSFIEVETSMVSQNFGNNNHKRGLKIVYVSLIYVSISTILVMLLNVVFFEQIVKLFVGKEDRTKEYLDLVRLMFKYEKYSSVAIGITDVMLNALYAYGLTKTSIYLNVTRLVILRIPVLLFLHHVLDLGPRSAGLVMFISNSSMLVLMILLFIRFQKKINLEHGVDVFEKN